MGGRGQRRQSWQAGLPLCGGLAYRGGSGGRARPLRARVPPTLVLVTRTRVTDSRFPGEAGTCRPGGVRGALPEGPAVTRDRARKKSVRAQMAAGGEPYSVAARKLGRTGAAGEAARDEVITRVEATLA